MIEPLANGWWRVTCHQNNTTVEVSSHRTLEAAKKHLREFNLASAGPLQLLLNDPIRFEGNMWKRTWAWPDKDPFALEITPVFRIIAASKWQRLRTGLNFVPVLVES